MLASQIGFADGFSQHFRTVLVVPLHETFCRAKNSREPGRRCHLAPMELMHFQLLPKEENVRTPMLKRVASW
jgi:hypothetical protein